MLRNPGDRLRSLVCCDILMKFSANSQHLFGLLSGFVAIIHGVEGANERICKSASQQVSKSASQQICKLANRQVGKMGELEEKGG